MATSPFRRAPARIAPQPPRRKAWQAALLASILAAPVTATEIAPGAGVSAAKVELRPVGAAAETAPAALCGARIAEGSSRLALLCRHALGTEGRISIFPARAAGPEPPFWSAPLASPLETEVELPEPALAALLAAGLSIRIDAGGHVVEGVLETPIFDSSFEIYSLCEWDNYPCPSDGNVCTYDYCNGKGDCSYVNHSVPCTRPHATAQCNNGICQITSCNFGYSNCNIAAGDGCEVNHNTGIDACAVDVNMVDNYAGDKACGVICPFNTDNIHTFATRKGRGEVIYSALAEEKSSCLSNVEHRLDLIVPEGVDYDLYVYRDCQLVEWSTRGPGLQEVVYVDEVETAQESDTFFYQVEVRYFDGASCQEWELQFAGYTC